MSPLSGKTEPEYNKNPEPLPIDALANPWYPIERINPEFVPDCSIPEPLASPRNIEPLNTLSVPSIVRLGPSNVFGSLTIVTSAILLFLS